MEQIISNIFQQSMIGFAKVLAEHPGATSEEILSMWSQFSSGVSVQISINGLAVKKHEEVKSRKRTFSEASSEESEAISQPEVFAPLTTAVVSSREEEQPKAVVKVAKTSGKTIVQCAFKPSRGKAAGIQCIKNSSAGRTMCCLHKKHDPLYVEEDKADGSKSETASASGDASMSAEFVVEDEDGAAGAAKVVPKTEHMSKTSKNACTFTIVKGESKGQPCGAAAKEGELCARHSKILNKEPKLRTEPVVPAVSKKQDVIIVSIHKPTGRWYHKDSGFVFESEEKKIVVSRLRGDNIEPINEDDVDEIMRYGFKFELPKKQEASDAKVAVMNQPAVKIVPKTVVPAVAKPVVQVQILSKQNVEDIVGELLEDSNDGMRIEDEDEEEHLEEEEELLEEDE
uniref:Uncharacterized protein n=1 Tax=viral metagenome TaxID=1070528 RepID=A0A6C0KRS9_9ZZZZ